MPLKGTSQRLAQRNPEADPLEPAQKRRKTSTSCSGQTSAESTTASTEILDDLPDLIKSAKQKINAYFPTGKQDEKLPACLNAFLDYLPETGCKSVAKDVLQCGDDSEMLFEVFENLYTSFLVPMKAISRSAPVTQSSHSAQGNQTEAGASELLESPLRRQQRFREDCLQRDGYRCLISGLIDREHFRESGSTEEEDVAGLDAAHIIPFSYSSFEETEVSPTNSFPMDKKD
ncbi:hypothetical protein AJ79_04926 [Helicocarpus griseus UAMH5409]|uniref:Uncharacterized protein n=1 Tax=Helicocarpus griseus UAMH5409 TaxID=1447875 RepID=A0A2B7XQR0_9EURO|nr:hypothetical protein AJ79_04926 [Helicocarpus griseus UAMH5409]